MIIKTLFGKKSFYPMFHFLTSKNKAAEVKGNFRKYSDIFGNSKDIVERIKLIGILIKNNLGQPNVTRR